jgi:hypothetical protein
MENLILEFPPVRNFENKWFFKFEISETKTSDKYCTPMCTTTGAEPQHFSPLVYARTSPRQATTDHCDTPCERV